MLHNSVAFRFAPQNIMIYLNHNVARNRHYLSSTDIREITACSMEKLYRFLDFDKPKRCCHHSAAAGAGLARRRLAGIAKLQRSRGFSLMLQIITEMVRLAIGRLTDDGGFLPPLEA
jgi:hypothetical protein